MKEMSKEEERRIKLVEDLKNNMPQYVDRLLKINANEITERQFYEQIISIIIDMGEGIHYLGEYGEPEKVIDYTGMPDSRLTSALQKIGCLNYKEWQEWRKSNDIPQRVSHNDSVKYANLDFAIGHISSLMDHGEVLEEISVLQEWLANSQLISKIVENPNPEDITKLSEDEQDLVGQALEQEVSNLTRKKEQLSQQNDIVNRIVQMAKLRIQLKKEIAQEEKEKQNNIHLLDEI